MRRMPLPSRRMMMIGTLLLGSASVVWAEPFFQQQDIFISGIDGVNIYRIPTLIVSSKGTILAFCEAREGDDGDPTDVVLKRSLYRGRPDPPRMLNGYSRTFGYGVNWQRMQVVLPGNGKAIMQNTPVIDRTDGTIFLCCYEVSGGLREHLKHPYAGRVLLLASTDDGVSWSPPRDITESVGAFIAGPGVGIQLRSGRMVIPGYGAGSSRVIYSDDHGETWHAGAQVGGKTDESQVVELADGALLLNMRSNRGQRCRYVAFSRDGGETWHEEHDEKTLPETVCQASILRYPSEKDGGENRLLFSNPANPGPWIRRTNLTVKLSRDEGRSWPTSRQVYAGPGAYSCLAVLADGKIGLLYETGDTHPYERIAFARFNLDWLTTPEEEP